MTTSSADVDPAVSRFLDAVWMERGLSSNTLAAYRADLTALGRWLTERQVGIVHTSRADLQDFIAWRVHAGARPRSTARQLSSFRRFFRYLVREGEIREDPTAQIAMPKIGRSLPKSLTEEEVVKAAQSVLKATDSDTVTENEMRRVTSKPSITGIITSSTMASWLSLRASSSPAAPSKQTVTELCSSSRLRRT